MRRNIITALVCVLLVSPVIPATSFPAAPDPALPEDAGASELPPPVATGQYLVHLETVPAEATPGREYLGERILSVNVPLRYVVVEPADASSFFARAGGDANVRDVTPNWRYTLSLGVPPPTIERVETPLLALLEDPSAVPPPVADPYAMVEKGLPPLAPPEEGEPAGAQPESETPVGILATPNDPQYGTQYAPQQVRANLAWDTTYGSNTAAVCVLDTGVRSTHEDITARWLGGRDTYNNDNDPSDDNGHGTAVAGAAAASVNNALGVAGMGNVGIYGVKIMSAAQQATVSSIADGITWCADNTVARTVLVMSFSLGDPVDATIVNALNRAYDTQGKLVVAAAGNSGPCQRCVNTYPQRSDRAIAVTATAQGEVLANFSSTGSKVDLSAPGMGVLTTRYTSNTAYGAVDGTSFAAPGVAGVAALVWSQATTLTNNQLRDRLRSTAQDLGPIGWDPYYGYGEVDAKCLMDNTVPCAAGATGCDLPGPDNRGYNCLLIDHWKNLDISTLGATALTLADDQLSGALPLGFTFQFYGASYTNAYVSSNGFLTFSSTSGHGCCSGQQLPSATAPNNLVAGYWEDLNPAAGGSIHYGTFTVGAHTIFILQFKNVPHYGGGNTVSFKIFLYSNNAIHVYLDGVTSDGGNHATGIENADGTVGLRYKYGSYSASNVGLRFNPGQSPNACETPGPDAGGYACTPIAFTYTDISGTGTALSLGDDQVSAAIPIGFSYDFYGTTYTNAYVSSNGFVTFTSGGHGCCSGQQLPSASTPNHLIAGYWEDLNPTLGGTIKYQTLGSSPSRTFVVQWSDVPHHNLGGKAVSFQIVLFEGSKKAEVHVKYATSDRGLHATGIENAGGTAGLRLAYGDYSANAWGVRFLG